jgi:hypothetical protein
VCICSKTVSIIVYILPTASLAQSDFEVCNFIVGSRTVTSLVSHSSLYCSPIAGMRFLRMILESLILGVAVERQGRLSYTLYTYTPINIHYIHIYTYTHIHIYTYTHIHLYIHIYTHLTWRPSTSKTGIF